MKQKIFNELNKASIQKSPLPEYGDSWIEYEDKISQFEFALKAAGGELKVCESSDLMSVIQEKASQVAAKKIVSCYEEVQATKPHDLEDVDLAVVEGEFAVAENAAIWIEDSQLPQRSLLYLSQHLIIVVNKNKIFNHLAEAYDEISSKTFRFGQFISGPSKTADIEQALVIGAHGPLSTMVIFI